MIYLIDMPPNQSLVGAFRRATARAPQLGRCNYNFKMYKIIYAARSFIAASLLLIFISGCGTIQRNQIDGLYPATKGDVFLIYAGFSNFIHMEGKVPLSQQVILRSTLIIIGIVDLPISLTTDTLFMPYDIAGKNDENRNYKEEEIEK